LFQCQQRQIFSFGGLNMNLKGNAFETRIPLGTAVYRLIWETLRNKKNEEPRGPSFSFK